MDKGIHFFHAPYAGKSANAMYMIVTLQMNIWQNNINSVACVEWLPDVGGSMEFTIEPMCASI